MERMICCNGKPVQYRLCYKRVKNVNIRVASNGTVQVSANRRTPAEEVDRIVQKKADWIARAKAYYAEQRTETRMPIACADGEPVRLLGRVYRLRVRKADGESIQMDGETIWLFVKDPENQKRREKVFDIWHRALCKEVFAKAALNVFPLFRNYAIPMPTFSVRAMKTRWGSCSPQKRAVTLNLHLAQAPVSCVEYVVAHELAHLIQANHSARFYAVLDNVMPDHRERKQLLKDQKIDCSGVR